MKKITRTQALEIAVKEFERLGWPHQHPSISWGLHSFTVWGNNHRGGQSWAVVRKRDGRVIKIGITPK
jgi:hypothetical protein